MKRFAADLHIHTALSPCASEEMTPPAIVQAALARGLAMIAITDHNTAANAAAVQQAAAGGLVALAGMEVTTAEEVHVLGLFPDADCAMAAGRKVRATLPQPRPGARRLGEQFVLDAAGRVVGKESALLTAGSGFDLCAAIALIQRHRGLAIGAHVDRPSFSVLSQLGRFPAHAAFDAIEVRGELPAAAGLPPELSVLRSSDSHFLSGIGCVRSVIEAASASFEELALALRGVGGRRVCDV